MEGGRDREGGEKEEERKGEERRGEKRRGEKNVATGWQSRPESEREDRGRWRYKSPGKPLEGGVSDKDGKKLDVVRTAYGTSQFAWTFSGFITAEAYLKAR